MADAVLEPKSRPASPSIRMYYRVREGAEEEFDHWLRDLSWCEMNAEGNRGVLIERKLIADSLEYHVESRFSSDPCLSRWLDSEQRSYWLSKLARTTAEPPEVEAITVANAADTKEESDDNDALTIVTMNDKVSNRSSCPVMLWAAKFAVIGLVLLIQAI